MNEGYLRTPSIRGDTIVFVTEDDLWTVNTEGGTARRLTSNLGPVGRAAISPDGTWIAFTGTEEHHAEIFVMPAGGGPARRLTYLGARSSVEGWAPDGRVLFASDAAQPFAGHRHLYLTAPEGGVPEQLPFGPATEASFAPSGDGVVIGRHTADPARWKRYRGGTRGEAWVDRRGDGTFRRLASLDGNLASPMWLGRRIYFLSDHEGIGNLYSCRADGRDVRRHTDHDEFYARWAKTDGTRIVYQLAAEIWLYDPDDDSTRRVDVDLGSPRVQRNRKFVGAAKFVHDVALHPEGHSLALSARGKLYTMPLWEQAVRQYGVRDGVRYRLPRWTHDAGALVAVSDQGGEEALEVYPADDPSTPRRLDDVDLGRAIELVPSPAGNEVAVANHRMELLLVDLDAGTARILDRSPYHPISGLAWAPDGRFLAYACSTTTNTTSIKLWETSSGDTHLVTRPEFNDLRPSFDPDGRYLYFLSYRVLDPVFDYVSFDLGFPRPVRPHLVTLRADEPSPFVPKPKGFGEKKDDAKKDDRPQLRIDLEGIGDRVVAFPMAEGRYTQVWGIGGKVLFTNHPVTGSLGESLFDTEEEPKGKLEVYDLNELKHDVLVQGISSFRVSQDGGTLLYRAGRRLRALKAGDKPDKGAEHEGAGRRSGWIDLGRVRVSVDPPAEWRQMFREAWRFQRDHFWVADMSGVDWDAIHERYLPLTDKVATRLEFSDLMWEMLGELGTSHAYEIGGDVKPPPPWPLGHLGCDYAFAPRAGRWSVAPIVRGDSWDPERTSPLTAPGVGVREGDTILAVNGQAVGPDVSPQMLLVHQAGVNVELTVGDRRGRNPRTVVVRTLRTEEPARYREWVETNRARIHEQTDGRVGYVHIPDMGAAGYSEFHRAYKSELDREALIVDVRFNSGGFVSELLLEKLARQRFGYAVTRWGAPHPYPEDSPSGPLVCITNEQAGSDGDIFTHVFKLARLGPVVGKRTWGGVIGITMRHVLVDNGITTQPEFSFWFKDVRWQVENYGTDPDHDVDIKPQDHAAGRDPQMDTALKLVMRALRRHRPVEPDLEARPVLTAPKLPPREGPKKRRR